MGSQRGIRPLFKKLRGVKEGLGHSLKSLGVSKRGEAPLFKKYFPLSLIGEGDTGGEVDKYKKGDRGTTKNLNA